MSETKKVLIVGAGPAGLAAAIEIKKETNDFDVVVLEKNPKISYKICAGGISADLSRIGMPEEIIDRKFNEIKVFTPKQAVLIQEDKPIVATVNRKTLHEFMAKEATELGVRILFSKFVKEINNNSVVTSSGDIFCFDYLVGADGSNSTIRKDLGLKTKKVLLAFQYMIPGEYSDMEFYFDFKKFGLSYAWIFPQKGIISAGTGYDLSLGGRDLLVKDLRKNFDLWCKKKFDLKKARFEAFSINYDYQGFEFRNRKIFLTGDAAGFASGLTGEGIEFAILSGRDIAKKIVDPNYRCEGIEKILRTKKRGENFTWFISTNRTMGKMTIELFTFFLQTSVGRKVAAKMF